MNESYNYRVMITLEKMTTQMQQFYILTCLLITSTSDNCDSDFNCKWQEKIQRTPNWTAHSDHNNPKEIHKLVLALKPHLCENQ